MTDSVDDGQSREIALQKHKAAFGNGAGEAGNPPVSAPLSLDDVIRALAADPEADEAALHESAWFSESAFAAGWDTPDEDAAWRNGNL